MTKAEEFVKITIELMAHKYAYYVMDAPIIGDYTYDMLEHGWAKLGEELGLTQEGEHTPCVGFDENHPQAKTGIELYDNLKNNKKEI